MKREAFHHWKTIDLGARLGVPKHVAFAHICYMLNWCADNAPQGNIGKCPNAAIARGAEWLGDPDEFVAALVESGWLDECQVHRLCVHDLEHHIERWWSLKLAKMKMQVISACSTTEGSNPQDVPSIERSIERSIEATTEGSNPQDVPSTPCDQTKPNQTKPNLKEALPPLPLCLDTPDFQKAWVLWVKHRSEIKKPVKPTQTEAMLEQLAGWGEARAIAAIRHTITMGWQGLREPESKATTNGKDYRHLEIEDD